MIKYESISIDPQIGKMLDITSDSIPVKQVRKGRREFCELYSTKNIEDIDWIEFCNDVAKYGCFKYAFTFFVNLLKNDLYHGPYAEYLYSMIEMFELITSEYCSFYSAILCKEKITELIIYKNQVKDALHSYAFVERHNDFIRSELLNFLNINERKYLRWTTQDYLFHFEKSFSQYKDNITNYNDFNGNTIFAQIDYYKDLYKDDDYALKNAIRGVVCFYRYLVNHYTEYDFFENSFNMNKGLLFNNQIITLLEDDFTFMTFSPTNHPGTKSKVCFLIKGFEDISTRITSDDWAIADISMVEYPEYRRIMWSYMITATSSIMLTWTAQMTYVGEVLKFLLDMKNQKDYPNKNKKYLTNQEAVLIRNYIDTYKISLSTKNNRIGAARRFFNYAKDNNLLEFDDMFFDYLRQYEEPSHNTAKAVPDDKLVLINSKLIEKAKTEQLGKISYAIFHLALQTEFRINQICHLKVDCIRPSIKPNQFMICTNSKTSHGAVESYVITDLTYKILMDIIEDTEEIRDKCNIESLKDYIFLYDGLNDGVALVKDNIFGSYLNKVCKELGFEENYTASNLRDTHMTKAFEHILRSGKSDIEMGVLSKHRHIDTTKNHYIEMELEKMLEATYGIVIGEEYIETDSKIVDEIPSEINTKENDVENGCGKCTAKTCDLTSSLPCLTCKHFITTTKHEIFFKKAIENVDRLIEKTINKHDKEDLITIKQLYVLYLKAIYKHKEEQNNG